MAMEEKKHGKGRHFGMFLPNFVLEQVFTGRQKVCVKTLGLIYTLGIMVYILEQSMVPRMSIGQLRYTEQDNLCYPPSSF